MNELKQNERYLLLSLTFLTHYGILRYVPMRNNLPGKRRNLGTGYIPCIGTYPKGDAMKPMKKPVRLLGMVFQID